MKRSLLYLTYVASSQEESPYQNLSEHGHPVLGAPEL